MSPEDIEKLFTNKDGAYAFARWGRPIVPVVFGVDEASLSVIKGAIEAMVSSAGHKMAETDPELGANLMLFFFSDWDELLDVPRLGEMVPDLVALVARLKGTRASQYRGFRFDDAGAIQACFSFVCLDDRLSETPAETLAMGQALGAILTWVDGTRAHQMAFASLPQSGEVVLRPDMSALIRAAYDPVMPAVASNASHALRLAARMVVADQDG